jgi:hypothetical protein
MRWFSLRKLIRQNKGQTVVELALVLPVLIFLLLAIMEGGRIFAAYLELQNAARDGARYAAIHCPEDSKWDTWVSGELTTWIHGRLSMLGSSNLTIECAKKSSSVEVVLKYPLPVTTPIISSLTGNPLNLSVQMAMRREH